MVLGTRKVLFCLAVLLFVLVEGRWHSSGSPRGHRMRDSTSDAEPTALLAGDEEGYPEASRPDDEPYARHRRHRPAASSETKEDEDADVDEESHEDSAEYEEPREAHRDQRRRRNHARSERRSAPRHHQLHRRRESGHHEFGASLDPLELAEEQGQEYGQGAMRELLLRNHARGKRHNRRRAWTEKAKKSFNGSRPKPEHLDSDEKSYEVEVREAQNSSLCNYTVVPIPNPGGRVPRELEHVKCNHVGSKCQDKGTYCCIQTYRHIEVLYEASGKKETLKVYSGCVCSLQVYGTLDPYLPDLDIHD